LFKEFLIDHSHGIATLFMSVCSQEMGGFKKKIFFGDVAPTVIGKKRGCGITTRCFHRKTGEEMGKFFSRAFYPSTTGCPCMELTKCSPN
jgi:hypothetical protein